MDPSRLCGKCEEVPGDIFCSCGDNFCHDCFYRKHLIRNPEHRRGGDSKTETFWKRVTGALSGLAGAVTTSNQFKRDEATKWFGLLQRTVGRKQINSLVETPRFRDLMDGSLHHWRNSPKIQFPSLTSFVGFTGAGKSLLIRTLMYHCDAAQDFKDLEAPVPGASSGDAALISTTGEVNMYIDPSTYGTETPMFYVDCEGLNGTEPLAAQHQSDWARVGKKHEIQAEMDRRTAVRTLYPRFLYIFSDVVCYVTKDHKGWADSAVWLLDWSQVGAQHTINQYSLPALIIVLNASTLTNEMWISEDQEVVTNAFFRAVEDEIRKNNKLRALAAKYGDTTMRQLFSRSYSSVYVHYIPFKGFQPLGTSEVIYKQTARLAARIKQDAARVLQQRADSWTRFDTRQMSLVVDFAFHHLAKGNEEPFDFGQCRRQMTIPDSTELGFAEYLRHCLDGDLEQRFQATAAGLGSAILKNALTDEGSDLVLVPSVVFNPDIRAVCKRAIIHFLDESTQCTFVDPDSGERCANTKKGHAKGHQRASGQLLKEGLFVDGEFDASRFILSIEECVLSVMKAVNPQAHSSRRKWKLLVSKHHREHIRVLRNLGGYPKPGTIQDKRKLGFFLRTGVCYGCLFGKPEYRLPCGHVICESCLRDSDQGEAHGRQTGLHMLQNCLICGDTENPGWPYKIRLRPLLSGLRVLSLDGGGVRGIVELVLLEKVESLIGLDLPIGVFFDLMVGTSSGGIISLGLGPQGRSVKDCMARFRSICNTGFDNKFLTKTWGVGWLARWVRSSIYTSSAMEEALQTAFKTKPPETVFGMENHCRNAVTTTVGKDCFLIANYNRGGTGMYMNSELSIWSAARCTSAAPMFFEPKRHDGCDCRDGGLKWNNPVQLAVNESRAIWGEKAIYDLVLSVGTGQAEDAQGRPSSKFIIPDWLSGLFTALLSTMSGEDEWARYLNSQQRVTERSSRLNIRFPGRQEPALDDFKAIGSMEQTARDYGKFYERLYKSPFNPISHAGAPAPTNTLELVAERLRASMYYFELRSVEKAEEVTIFIGSIRCRLGPSDEGYHKLLKMTAGFKVKESFYGTSELSESTLLNINVVFSHQSPEEPIRIDVSFEKQYSVTISGFPMKMKTLVKYSEENLFQVQPASLAVELDGAPLVPAADAEGVAAESDLANGPSEQSEASLNASQTAQGRDGEPATIVQATEGLEHAEQFVRAAQRGDLGEVKQHLMAGVAINCKQGGWTALGRAAREGKESVVRTLVEAGADLDIRMDVGWGVLPGDGTALNWAAAGGHLDTVQYLVSRGAAIDIDAKKPAFFGTGGTPMTMAAGQGRLGVVRFLFGAGSDSQSPEGIRGWAAFICACGEGRLDVVKYLVEDRNVAVNHQDTRDGTTAMIMAARYGEREVMEYLVSKSASLDGSDSDGNTPLHHVAKGSKDVQTDVVTAAWLRRRGADLGVKNRTGKMPLDLAQERLLKAASDSADKYRVLVDILDTEKAIPEGAEEGNPSCSIM